MPCNPLDFQIPHDREENNSYEEILKFEKELLEQHSFVTKLLKKIRDNFSEHPLFVKSLETITKNGFTIVDDDVIFRNKLLKVEKSDEHYTRENFNTEMDIALCVKRQELLHLYKTLPDNGFMTRPHYDEIKKLHLFHRQDDQKQWLNWLCVQRENLLKDPGLEKSAQLREKLDKVQNEIDRVRDLKDHDLISDREIFGRNPEEFS